jgi:UDP-glucose 4-epimerase
MRKRIAVTGAQSPLGHAVMRTLRASTDVECVRGVIGQVLREGRGCEDLDLVPLASDHRPMVEYIEREHIDTIIQCGPVHDRCGLDTRTREADVITTMCLGAAIGQSNSSVRNWVLASSSAVYPIASHTAMLQREAQPPRHDHVPDAYSIAEAEDFARDVAERRPHLNVAILRLQQLIGPEVRGPLSALLDRDPVPMPMGFDPAIQLLHLDDAASAMAFAVDAEVAGIYNVASSGVIRWREAVRATGHKHVPALPFGAGPAESVLIRLGFPVIPMELIDLLRFGHAVDTGKIERAGWKPRFDQRACLALLRRR